ncbi:MAG: glucose 1-dehydrogenase [Phycisphaerales bacterium]|nr:glucose 1-dehydrogenase [Phycisphaerales bacterium]
MASEKLTGKVAIITGASKGIGAAIARGFATEGASVVVNYASSKQGADAVVGEITKAGGRAIAVQADCSKEDDIRRMFDETRRAFGRVDILVNNAGVYEFVPLQEVTPARYHRMFDLNVLGVILASREAVRNFGSEGGVIINLSSVASRVALPAGAVYCATKAAVDAVTRCLAAELGPRQIRVNSINPALVETEGVHAAGLASGDFREQQEAQTPLGRIGQPDDIVPLAIYLASSDASWMTGESLYITGGVR